MPLNKHTMRPRRHSRPRADLLLRIDTTILRLTSALDELRALRWDVDHSRDMRTAKTRLDQLDPEALRRQLNDLYERLDRDNYDLDDAATMDVHF